MGMFDYTYFKCPECGEIAEEQSKASDCGLKTYFFGDIAFEVKKVLEEGKFRQGDDLEDIEFLPAPLEIVAEAQRYGLQCHCGTKVRAVPSNCVVLTPFGED